MVLFNWCSLCGYCFFPTQSNVFCFYSDGQGFQSISFIQGFGSVGFLWGFFQCENSLLLFEMKVGVAGFLCVQFLWRLLCECVCVQTKESGVCSSLLLEHNAFIFVSACKSFHSLTLQYFAFNFSLNNLRVYVPPPRLPSPPLPLLSSPWVYVFSFCSDFWMFNQVNFWLDQ